MLTWFNGSFFVLETKITNFIRIKFDFVIFWHKNVCSLPHQIFLTEISYPAFRINSEFQGQGSSLGTIEEKLGEALNSLRLKHRLNLLEISLIYHVPLLFHIFAMYLFRSMVPISNKPNTIFSPARFFPLERKITVSLIWEWHGINCILLRGIY